MDQPERQIAKWCVCLVGGQVINIRFLVAIADTAPIQPVTPGPTGNNSIISESPTLISEQPCSGS